MLSLDLTHFRYLRKYQGSLAPNLELIGSSQSFPSDPSNVFPFEQDTAPNYVVLPGYQRSPYSQERERDVNPSGASGSGPMAVLPSPSSNISSHHPNESMGITPEPWNPTLALALTNQTGISPIPASQSSPSQPVYSRPSVSQFSPDYTSPSLYTSLNPATANPFDKVLPRALLLHTIDLYFDYVYALVPCLHKPTFMRDIRGHREERPDEEEWIALVFAVVAFTLIQMPRAFVSLPRRDVKALAQRCHSICQEYLNKDFRKLTVTRCEFL